MKSQQLPHSILPCKGRQLQREREPQPSDDPCEQDLVTMGRKTGTDLERNQAQGGETINHN